VNPLLNITTNIPFSQIRAEYVEPAIAQLLTEARAAIDAIASTPSPDYENAVLALDRATERLDRAVVVVRHLESVATTPELRAAHNAIEPLVSGFYSSIPLNEALWNTVKQVSAAPAGIHSRFLRKTIDGFLRAGAALDADKKKRLSEIDVELARTTTKFSENVLDSTNSWELYIEDEAGLAGLPESARAAARQRAEARGRAGWRFTLQEPSYVAVMTYLDDAGVREKMYRAYNTRATEPDRDNAPLVLRILELRREKARLLGFDHFADLVLEERMAHTGDRALSFQLDLEKRSRARFEQERQELEAFAGRALSPWDVSYWAEKMRRKLYDFDEEELRPYFPLDGVVGGMFAIFEGLFGIAIEEVEEAEVWDAQVRKFQIRSGDRVAGYFYADWYPRDNKRGGAWMDCLINGGPGADGFEPHVGLICGNLTPPLGDKPALLTHREVETIFHEFGHLLHQLLSVVEVRSLCGTHVAWDFVELPSQIMENWCWEKDALDRFGCHHETREPIPTALFEKMRRARTYRAATAQMRQLSFGVTDLKLHMDYRPERDGDVVAYARQIMQPFSAAPLPDDHAMIAAFTHLFSDPVAYGAGYYSYKWAEVLDADAFSRFRAEGIFNPATGADYRDQILARGDSDDPATLFRGFMGRDPDPSALLARLGLDG
jgi:oligopeptidase A